jgi:hypothetical protein
LHMFAGVVLSVLCCACKVFVVLASGFCC